MIDSIRIRNIQSHKDTELDLCPGINVIVGSSNNGKTAILRSLYWSIYNRPLGIDSLCSHWALDDKGNIKDEMSVEVRKGDDVLIRRKAKNVNQYVLNGDELNAIKTDVPPEVKAFYRLNETNIQRQQDAPFLVSNTSGEVARYFNGIAHLDVIDNTLSIAEGLKRQQRRLIEMLEKNKEEQEGLHSSFSWIDGVSTLLDKMERLESREKALEAKIEKLSSSISAYGRCTAEIEPLSKAAECRSLIEEIEAMKNEMDSISAKAKKLNDSIKMHKHNNEVIELYKSLPADLVSEHEYIKAQRDLAFSKMDKLKYSIVSYKKFVSSIEEKKLQIEKWESELPDICPLCGNPMKEGNHDC